jgi:hypothetical protein
VPGLGRGGFLFRGATPLVSVKEIGPGPPLASRRRSLISHRSEIPGKRKKRFPRTKALSLRIFIESRIFQIEGILKRWSTTWAAADDGRKSSLRAPLPASPLGSVITAPFDPPQDAEF